MVKWYSRKVSPESKTKRLHKFSFLKRTGATTMMDRSGKKRPVFEEYEKGKFKCILCNTMVNAVHGEEYTLYFNIEGGDIHRIKKMNYRLKKYEHLCNVPPTSGGIRRVHRTTRTKIDHSNDNSFTIDE